MKFLFIEWGVIRVIAYEKYFGCNWISIVVFGGGSFGQIKSLIEFGGFLIGF